MDNDLMDVDGKFDKDDRFQPPTNPRPEEDPDLPALHSADPTSIPPTTPNSSYILLHHLPDAANSTSRKTNSMVHSFGSFNWRLLIFPMGNDTPEACLSLYLECCGPTKDLEQSTTATHSPAHIRDPDGTLETRSIADSPTGQNLASKHRPPGMPWKRAATFKLFVINQKEAEAANLPIDYTNISEAELSGIRSTGSLAERLIMLPNNVSKGAQHRFSEQEVDWGFKDFVPHSVSSSRDFGFGSRHGLLIAAQIELVDDSAIQDTSFLPPVDTRKETGFVGLKNQGATCYMNSLLQTLYSLGEFRRAVYRMPVPDKLESSNSSTFLTAPPDAANQQGETSFALQKLFYELQYSDTIVKTKKLTESFGWDTSDAFTQHDVQELNRILCDHLEEKMKENSKTGPNTIAHLFEGKIINYIECLHVQFESKREESFYDLSLNVKGCRNLYESFEKYTEVETLDGDNKYRADGFDDLQEARKGVRFLKLPPVLQLHLKRFEYDFSREMMVKINDRFEFDTEIDLSKFVEKSDGDDIYLLHSVLVHIGDVHGGHYYAFIRPDTSENRWLKFDDEIVEKSSATSAVNDNFGLSSEKRTDHEDSQLAGLGGQTPPYPPRSRIQSKRFSNAYMLQYVLKREAAEIFGAAVDSDIPKMLRARIEDEKEEEEQRRKDRTEQHLYVHVVVARESNLAEHHGSDLLRWENAARRRVKRTTTLGELKVSLRAENCRLWKCSPRRNKSIRPEGLLADGDDSRPISDTEFDNPSQNMRPSGEVLVFVEQLKLQAVHDLGPNERLIFVKEYRPSASPPLSYTCHCLVKTSDKALCLTDVISKAAQFSSEDEISHMFEEIRGDQLIDIDPRKTFVELDMVGGGDIVVFQRVHSSPQLSSSAPERDLTLAPDYYAYMERGETIVFRERSSLGDSGIEMKLLDTDEQSLIRRLIAKELGNDVLPDKIRLFGADIVGDYPKPDAFPVSDRLSLNQMLRDGLRFPSLPKVLWYEVCFYDALELEVKTEVRISWRPDAGAVTYPRRGEAALYEIDGAEIPAASTFSVAVARSSSFSAVFDEVRAILGLPSTFMIRLLEVKSSLITQSLLADVKVPTFQELSAEIRCEPDTGSGTPLSVIHLPRDKSRTRPSDVVSAFGSPFFIKVAPGGEELGVLRERMMSFLGVSQDEFRTWRVVAVRDSLQSVSYIDETSYLVDPVSDPGLVLGLEHRNEYPVPHNRRFLPSAKPLLIRPKA